MNRILTLTMLAGALAAGQAHAQILDLSWRTVDAGGGASSGSGFTLEFTIGQFDAGAISGFDYEVLGGYWPGTDAASCYANCDGSTIAPVLNVNDFICFQQRFAAADPLANCDGSTIPPVPNVNDFICFQQKFAGGCP